MLIQASSIAKSYGTTTVLDGVSFTISDGDRVGLVGPNGSGKTTLLRILRGELAPDQGELVVQGSPVIGFMRQDVVEAAGTTLEQAVFGELEALEHRLEALARQMAEGPEGERALVKYGQVESQLEAGFGAEFRARTEGLLEQFGLGLDRLTARVMELSPGERARLELTRVLAREPDLLILDEPTNFLDIEQREWLEQWLGGFEGVLLVVSHDRTFLNVVVDRVFELRRTVLTVYEGDYDAYEQARDQQQRRVRFEYEQQTKEIRKLERLARTRKTWAARKEKEKIGAGDKGFVSARAARMARRAKHAERRIQQMLERHRAEKPFIEKRVRALLPVSQPPDKRAVRVSEITKSFGGRRVLDRVGFEIGSREKVALVGPNGSGKTVLLRVLVGEVEPDSGEVGFGAGLRVGYFPQDLGTLDPAATALDEARKSGAPGELARTVLGTLLLPKEFAERRLADLSAGERTKVLLARILAGGADFLVLDEPTNHLDIDALRALEELLVGFPGGILFASHDRTLLSVLAGRVLEVRNGRLVDYRGDYRHYRRVGRRESTATTHR